MRVPSTKANPVETEAFYLEILAELAGCVVSLERGRNSHAERLDELDEAVASLFNRESRDTLRYDEAKADDK